MAKPVMRKVVKCEVYPVNTSGAFYWEKMAQRGSWTYYQSTLECGHVIYGMTLYAEGDEVSCPTCERTPDWLK